MATRSAGRTSTSKTCREEPAITADAGRREYASRANGNINDDIERSERQEEYKMGDGSDARWCDTVEDLAANIDAWSEHDRRWLKRDVDALNWALYCVEYVRVLAILGDEQATALIEQGNVWRPRK